MNPDERLKQREQISAMVDGQLSSWEVAAAVELTAVDDDARASWHVYHLVGDVLRSTELGACARDRKFLARLNTRLLAEVGTPRVISDIHNSSESIATRDESRLAKAQNIRNVSPGANEDTFRWKLVAGFASLAAIVAISWSAVGLLRAPSEGALLAQTSTPPAIEGGFTALAGTSATVPAAPVMIRDRDLDALMAAHRQFGGNSALQNPSGFLRNATFDGVAR